MKKLLLPLLLIILVSMLAAVESEPSEVVGYVKYVTSPGFNYVAVAMDNTVGTAEGLVASHNPNVSSVFKFNPVTQGWSSIVYDADLGWSSTMPVVPGDAILLNCVTGFDFFSIGDLPEPLSYEIKIGYNYIQVPLNRADFTAAELIGNEIGNISSIFKFNPVTQGWSSIVYDADLGWSSTMPVSIGDVILIQSSVDTTWSTIAPPIRSSFRSKVERG